MVTCKQSISYKDLLKMPVQDLFEWCENNLLENIPESLETEEQINEVKTLLNVITNKYAFSTYAYTFANLEVRRLKSNLAFEKSKANKDSYDEMMAKRIILEKVSDILKQQYQSLSRSYAVVQDQKREYAMYADR